ncbi:hypothetical protein M514_01297 [Trichuris suis]|uniref:CX domain-containing protein n=1 Tax=Trichuris suis TaxID=68888 RepID=A0A085NS45_9BILA|nr:hypothetical protein M514_01297 [Trichuris suis]
MRLIFLIALICVMLMAHSQARNARTTRGGVFSSARNWFKSAFRPKPKPVSSTYGRSSSYGRTSSYGKPKSWGSYNPPTPHYVAPIQPRSRGSTTKSILAGLAAGYVGYKMTKGVSRLMHNGIRYYPANSYYSDYSPSYSQPSTYGGAPLVRVRCEYDLPEDEMNMVNITMSNGARATKLIYECDFHTQICCGMECCPKSSMG